MAMSACRVVVVVAITYMVSTAMFVDGLPTPEEDHAALAADESLAGGSDRLLAAPYKRVGESLEAPPPAKPQRLSSSQVQNEMQLANGKLVAMAQESRGKEKAKLREKMQRVKRKQALKLKAEQKKDDEAQKTAELITVTSAKVEKQLGRVVRKAAARATKAKADADAQKVYRAKAMAENHLPKSQQPAVAARVHDLLPSTSAPPADGLSDHAVPNQASVRAHVQAKEQAMKEVSHTKPKFEYNLMEAEHEAQKEQQKPIRKSKSDAKAAPKAKARKSSSKKVATAKAATKGKISCLNSDGSCNPNWCLCRSGKQPVPKHDVDLGESDDVPTAEKPAPVQVASAGFEPLPPTGGELAHMAPVAPAAQKWSEEQARKYVTFKHPDKFQQAEMKDTTKAIKMEQKIDANVDAAAESEKAMVKWEDAANKEKKAGHVKEQRQDAAEAWKDARTVVADAESIPKLAAEGTANGAALAAAMPSIDVKTGAFIPGKQYNPPKAKQLQTKEEKNAMKAAFAAEKKTDFHALPLPTKQAEKRLAAKDTKMKLADETKAEADRSKISVAQKSAAEAHLAKAEAEAIVKPVELLSVDESQTSLDLHNKAEVSVWTMKHTAALGKLMVVTQAVDKVLAKKKAQVSGLAKKLKRLRTSFKTMVQSNQKVRGADAEIVEGTEELSHEELGESKHGEAEELIETGEDGDKLGASLAAMNAKFAQIQQSMDFAANQEKQIETMSAAKTQARVTNLQQKAGEDIASSRKAARKKVHATLGEAAKAQVLSKQAAAEKEQHKLRKALDREEAQLRGTTVKKVRAQHKLQKSVDKERADQKAAQNGNVPLTPTELTRLEYKQMYLAQKLQQVSEKRLDVDNQVHNIQNEDAAHMHELEGMIDEKQIRLRDDIKNLRNLRYQYEHDHELGEGMSSESGATALAKAQLKQLAAQVAVASKVADGALNAMRQLRDVVSDMQTPLIKTAKSLLGVDGQPLIAGVAPVVTAYLARSQLGEGSEIRGTDTDSIRGIPVGQAQVKLASRISVAKTELKLKLDKFAALQSTATDLRGQAEQLHNDAVAAKDRESAALSRSNAMGNVVKQLRSNLGRHEDEMELGEALFTNEKTEDLGESADLDELGTDVKRFAKTIHEKPQDKLQAKPNDKQDARTNLAMPRMSAQDQISYVSSKMKEAELNLKHLDEDGPKIIQDQVTADRERYGARLKTLEAHLGKLQERFKAKAAQVSPRLQTQQSIEDAMNEEFSKQRDYRHGLDSVAEYAKMVDQEVNSASSYAPKGR